jgi:S1-C subfamily serine protease
LVAPASRVKSDAGRDYWAAPKVEESTNVLRADWKTAGDRAPVGGPHSRVEPGSPADKAGLRAGDVTNAHRSSIAETASSKRPRRPLKSSISNRRARRRPASNSSGNWHVAERSHAGRREQSRPADWNTGAVVENVEPFTPAANAGIKLGDVIVEINRQPIRSQADALHALSAIAGAPVFLLLRRQSGVQPFVELRKE